MRPVTRAEEGGTKHSLFQALLSSRTVEDLTRQTCHCAMALIIIYQKLKSSKVCSAGLKMALIVGVSVILLHLLVNIDLCCVHSYVKKTIG